jgi:DNA polymerase-4
MIAHLDVDCFFAQVEEVRLSLRGRPLGVQQNMEIAAVNYEARGFGLYNRISVEEGLRKCPHLMLVRGDNGVNAMQRYRCAGQAVLRCVMQSLDGGGQDCGAAAASAAEWTGRRVEHASFDDFFVLLPDDLATASAATAWGERLKSAVLRATGLRCSIGLARTKLLSVLATKRAKPNGLHCCVGDAEEHALLDSARIDRICGAGINGLASNVRGGLQGYLGKVTASMRTAFPL